MLEITLSHISNLVTAELPKESINLLPALLSYMISFIILGFFWITHDDQFHGIK